jgi:methyltransferase
MTATAAFRALVLAVAAERVAELTISRRNLRWSRQHGGVEHGAGHYPVMVALHSGLLAGALAEAELGRRRVDPRLAWPMVTLVVTSQALRWWCIRSLGPRWNTRVVVVPGLPLVTRGPYRFLRHPNYVAVAIEGAALPLVGSAWITATAFTALNLPLLAVRIRAEDAALAESRGGQR